MMETGHAWYLLRQHSPHASSSVFPNLHRHSRRRFHHRHHHQNVRRQANFIMPLRCLILTLRRITTTEYHFQFNHPTGAFCIANQFASISHHRMAEDSNNKDVVQGKADPTTTLNVIKGREEKDKASEKSTPAFLPLPEKPLPGDCCGSGCVRCVWDVYYEELEEYNRLYKADSKAS